MDQDYGLGLWTRTMGAKVCCVGAEMGQEFGQVEYYDFAMSGHISPRGNNEETDLSIDTYKKDWMPF